MLAALPYPPATAKRLLGALAVMLLWYVLLPRWFYHTPAVYLEGPLPAFLGAAFGLWLHQAETPRTQLLGACGWAMVVSILAVVVPGTLIFGPIAAMEGLYVLVRDVFHLPFLDAFRAIGSGYGLYVVWMGLKTLLAWGAIAYAVLLLTRYDLRSKLGSVFSTYSDHRTFTQEQRRQWKEYRHRYVEAVKAGGALPAAPAGLMPPGAMPAGSWHNRARFAYWAVRIGVALAGLFGLFTAFKAELLGAGGRIFFRGLFGG